MKKTKKMLNSKMQVNLPDSLSTENIMATIESSKAEVIEMPKRKNNAKKIVPLVASLLLVVGVVGMYMSLQEKDIPVNDSVENAEVMRYESYDKVYEKFDKLHKEAKKNNFRDFFYANDEEADMIADGAMPESAVGSVNGAATGSTTTDDTVEENTTTLVDKDFGTTNTQEKGVDEGDIIKTDGCYLYIANGENTSVSIVDVTKDKMKETAQVELKETELVNEIYINGDKLVIVGNLLTENKKEEYRYNHYALSDGLVYISNDTFVKVYDISDKNAPKLVTEYSQQGTYDNSRMIGTKLYTISEYYVNTYSDDYRDKCIPEVTVNDVCEPIPAGCISIVEESPSTTYAVITTLDLSKDAEPESEAILGECNHLYASSEGLFLCETTGDGTQDTTKIYKFDYTETGVEYKCTGKVNGYINNQFSMSYDGEYFRIATTGNNAKTDGNTVSFSVDDRTNNLYILNNDMEIVGKVENLAKGELIESVRFVGNMAYVVTFRQTDPLFVIDLSDPENPTVKGELKIPGFSEYLHPITENLIVGVGQDGTETGTNGDCKVSLFDVTDPYAPKETLSLPVTDGKGYAYSEIAYNHKLYVTLSNTEFAVPFTFNWYVNYSNIEKGGNYYIRYKLQNGTLCEMARYYLGAKNSTILGATYVEDNFYVVYYNYNEYKTEIVAFDLTTHEEIDRITTYEK